MREDFEVVLKAKWPAVRMTRFDKPGSPVDGEYVNDVVQAYWWGWRASRAALLIELPQQSGVNLDWNQAIRYCHQAIEAAGIKVKS